MFRSIILVIFILITKASACAKERLVLAADLWCPYNCTPGTAKEGYLIELAKIALEKDVEIIYTIKPWNQAVEEFNNGLLDGVLGAYDHDLDNPYLPAIPQAQSRVAAYTLKNKNWLYDGPSSLNNRIIGLTEAYDYPSELKSYVFSNYLAKPGQFYFSVNQDPVSDNIFMLKNGKIYTYIEDENVANYYLNKKNISNVRQAGFIDLTPENIFIAFSKKNPNAKKYSNMITTAMIELKNSGKLYELMAKYNIKNLQDVALLSK